MRATPVLGRAVRRLALSTKQAGKDYYKGTGTGSMGSHTKWGTYILDVKKMRTYVVPDLTGFEVCLYTVRGKHWLMKAIQLTPFVDRNVKPQRDPFRGVERGPVDGHALIEKWKAAGGFR